MKRKAIREAKRWLGGLAVVIALTFGLSLIEGLVNLMCHGTWS